jgi:hypothetical protein
VLEAENVAFDIELQEFKKNGSNGKTTAFLKRYEEEVVRAEGRAKSAWIGRDLRLKRYVCPWVLRVRLSVHLCVCVCVCLCVGVSLCVSRCVAVACRCCVVCFRTSSFFLFSLECMRLPVSLSLSRKQFRKISLPISGSIDPSMKRTLRRCAPVSDGVSRFSMHMINLFHLVLWLLLSLRLLRCSLFAFIRSLDEVEFMHAEIIRRTYVVIFQCGLEKELDRYAHLLRNIVVCAHMCVCVWVWVWVCLLLFSLAHSLALSLAICAR